MNNGWFLFHKVNKTFGVIIILFGRMFYEFGITLEILYARIFKFSRYFKAPLSYYIWKYIKYEPSNLIQDYIQQIPIDQRIGPVYVCTKKKFVSCALIGIDFLESNGNLYYLESNFNSAHRIYRQFLSENGDPVCQHLCSYASSNDFEKIVFYPFNLFWPADPLLNLFMAVRPLSNLMKSFFPQGYSSYYQPKSIAELNIILSSFSFDKKLEAEWNKIAKYYNIKIDVIDNPRMGSPYRRKSHRYIKNNPINTIYINGRYIAGPLGSLIGIKGLIEKEIGNYNRKVKTDSKVYIPKILSCNNDISELKKSSEFPNIIIKNNRIDMAKGIKIYKANKLPQFNKKVYTAYEYVIPDLIIRDIKGVSRKFVYKYRTYLLITPSEPVYVGAKKSINTIPIPLNIENGNLKNISPYIVHGTHGTDNVLPTRQENFKCMQATLALGNVIYYNFLRKKHSLKIHEC